MKYDKPLKIVCAAILSPGKVYYGVRHSDIFRDNLDVDLSRLPQCAQGFVGSDHSFYTREEAAKIAFEAGQIKRPKKALFSEDLY